MDDMIYSCFLHQLDDRRLVLENMMASLKVQNKQLKEKYEIEKQQNQKYKVSHWH